MAASKAELTATLEIKRERKQIYRTLKEGTLKPWLSVLTSATSPESLELDESSRLGSWENFPFEALFGDPPAFYKRIIENPAVQPLWAAVDNSPPLDDDAEQKNESAVAKRKKKDAAKKESLGLIGQQLFHLLDQREKTGGNVGKTYQFELKLEARQDLKVIRIRLVQPPENPPPFAYVGDWSHDEEDARNIKLTAVAALWFNKDYRAGAKSWLTRKDGPFFLKYPPLAHYQLTLEGTAALEAKTKIWNLDLRISIRLPHFLGRQSVITALPSLLTLKCPLAGRDSGKEIWRCKYDDRFLSEMLPRPSPPFREFFEDHDEPPKVATLLVASPHLRAAAERMSELWADRSLRNVLLIAPPGSGKEVLAEFLHKGSVFFGQERALLNDATPDCKALWIEYHEWERSITPLTEVSLAGIKDIAVVRQIVFGKVHRESLPGELSIRIDKKIDLRWTSGLILDARGTTVFLDEIDKCEPEIRSALLRFLENDEIYPTESPRPLRLDRLEKLVEDQQRGLKVRLLFAGSKPRKEILDSAPPDFWTRMHRIIEIPHPFEIPDARERKRCIQEYVLLFLYRGVQNKIKPKVKPGSDLEKLNDLLSAILNDEFEEATKLAAKKAIKKNAVRRDCYPFLYLSSRTAEKISSHAASFLARFSASALSVRNLGAIIKQLDYRIELWVEQGIDLLATQDPEGWKLSGERRVDIDRHLERAWIWGNLHDITLSLIR